MSLKSEIEAGLITLFDGDNNANTTVSSYNENTGEENANVSIPNISPAMKARITAFADTLATSILKLKVDIATTANPTGKLVINSANGGGTVVYASTTQADGGLTDG